MGPSSRNLPFDLAQSVLLLRLATESLYSVLPDNELVLLSLPSQNQSPSDFSFTKKKLALADNIDEKGVKIRKKN